MKNRKIIIISTLLLCFGTLNYTSVQASTATLYPDYIQDEDFATCIVSSSTTDGFTQNNQSLTQSNFEDYASDLTSLKCNNKDLNINNLSGLQYFENLRYLYLNDALDASVTTVPEQINSLDNLYYLYLTDNNISTIDNLSSMKSLKAINLDNNNITEIKNLSDLKSLTTLNLNGNNISKIENIDKLSSLVILDLSNNDIEKIENLDTLENPQKLSSLKLEGNKITNIQGLSSLTNLQSINLNNNNISSLDGIDDITSKRFAYLYLNENYITDFSQFDYITDDLSHIYVTDQKYETYLELDNQYPEFIGQLNPDFEVEGTILNLFGKNIHYTDTISNSNLVTSFDYNVDVLNLYTQENKNIDYDVNVSVKSYEPLSAQDASDYFIDAVTSEQQLISKLNASATKDVNIDLTDEIYISDLDGYDFNNPAPGVYNIVLNLDDPDLNKQEISVTYEVYEPPFISGENIEVYVDGAPKNEEELFNLLQISAIDYDDTDITDKVILKSISDYDYNNPEFKTYNITYQVEGESTNVVEKTFTLKIINYQPEMSSKDNIVYIEDAPTNYLDLFEVLNLEGKNVYNEDLDAEDSINYDVEILSMDNYDFSSIEPGEYQITIIANTIMGEQLKTSSTLTIVDDSTDEVTDSTDEVVFIEEDNIIQNTGVSYGVTTTIVLLIFVLIVAFIKLKLK